MTGEPPTRRRGRLLLIVAAALLALGSIALAGLYYVSSSPLLCNSCHIMKPYVAAWKTSKHNMVTCVECHYPPGFRDSLWVKYQALAQVAKWATQTYSSKPFAEVEDASCLRSGCHSQRLLEGKVVYKRGIIFDHRPHLLGVRRGRQLRCTSCHSQIVVGTHIEVTESTCFLCHFKGMKVGRELSPIAGCTGCHQPPKGEILVGSIRFSHEEMVRRGVACQKCHLNVIEGEGEAPRERCFTCHNQPEKLDRYGDTPFLHDFHVAGHNIECARCHTEIRHRLPPPIGMPMASAGPGGALLSLPGPGLLARPGPPVLLAQGPRPSLRPPAPAEPPPPPSLHRAGELPCRNCHEGKHRGVLLMYLGMGGRGTPMIPSHMFQVRVECVACHIVPKEPGSRAGIVGQTFRPSEQACLGCHGERYRGMLERWRETLTRMREALAPKLAGARAALAKADPKAPKRARAERLVADAAFNVEFVALGRGVHNVFYAADLLKVANGWLDEAFALLGVPPVKADDALVRGGYCAVLCHERAGVRLPETVVFEKQKVPHARHVTEFGAVCTACHSPEVHKAVTATAATCAGCHHSPQNERCEACHRVQSAFYRGETPTALVKVEPNSMAAAVSCTGCHDFTQRHSRQAVGAKCVECHDAAYLEFFREWTSGLGREAARAGDALQRADAAVGAARRAGRRVPEAEALAREAREALAIVRGVRGVHNPAAAEALLEAARRNAEEAAAQAGRR